MEIKYYSRVTSQVEVEQVYGAKAVEWLYSNPIGFLLSNLLIKKPISIIYGMFQDSELSKRKIKPFIKKFKINMSDYLPQDGRSETDPYSSFNQFFIRRFKPGKRLFLKENHLMPAFSEARYFGYSSVNDNLRVPAKGQCLSSEFLLDNPKWTKIFQNGPLLLARLCPVDYHRYHYPDSGRVIDSYPVKGILHSVNPLALKKVPETFCVNERFVTILETQNFGKLAYIEVGAICVGKIVQSHKGKDFLRGDEKGYFLFGGSTVIVLGEKGKWKPSQDILNHTTQGIETYLTLGSEVAKKV